MALITMLHDGAALLNARQASLCTMCVTISDATSETLVQHSPNETPPTTNTRVKGSLKTRKRANTHIWFGYKGSPRDGEAVFNGAEILGHDGEAAALSAPSAGC